MRRSARIPVLASGSGHRRPELLPPDRSEGGRQVRRPVSEGEAVQYSGPGWLAQGADRAFQRWRGI